MAIEIEWTQKQEQWHRFLKKFAYYESWSEGASPVHARKTRLKGNEYTYERLLLIPCFTMSRGRDQQGLYFEGWFSNLVHVARIIFPDNRVINYKDDEKGKEKFIRDFCELVSKGKEKEVDYVILDDTILTEFIKRVNEAVSNKEQL